MLGYQIPSIIKKKIAVAFLCLLLIAMIGAAFSFTEDEDFKMAKQQILLRKIGHEILLHSGDSTSRVLPIKKITSNEYQIAFEKEFHFQPDSLVTISRRALEKDDLAGNYVVTVLNCAGQEVLFGYAIFKAEKDSLLPCSGRQQPKGCYVVDVKFQNTGITPLHKGYLIGGLSLFAILGLLLASPFKIRKANTITAKTGSHTFQICNTLFDPDKRQITSFGITTELTPKENKLLRIFADSPNTIIQRSRIQKEIWEDEGVIVGRSLDVFISKLRKKLENDQSIQLINIHGKGYRLETKDF